MALGYNTGIPFDATYDPDAAYDHDRQGGNINLPNPADYGPAPLAPPTVNTVGVSGDMWWVNGKEFHTDDHQSAVESQEALKGPERAMPAGYRVVGPDEYKGYLKQIMDPTLGRLAKKNFGIGVDNLQLLGGYGLQLAGAEETGKAIVEQQVEDLRFNQPYQRTFTEDAASDPIGWFVANLAQQGPNLIESALAAIAGAGVGAMAGGNPFTAIGGMMMTLGSKGAVKKALIETARKKLRGEPLDPTEMKALREAASGAYAFNMKGAAKDIAGGFDKTAAKVGGAALATGASNYGIGAADIYGEQLDSGTPNRAAALGLAVPYAIMESLPELVGFGYFAKGAKVPWRGNKLRRGKQTAGAIGLGAVGEGLTEAGQESLLLSQNDEVDINSKEGIHRLINSFAAGAGVGGAVSGGASVLRRGPKERVARDLDEEEHDLLGIEQEERLGITDQREAEDMGNLGNTIEQEERLAIEDQREMGDLGNELEGPGPVPLLESPDDTRGYQLPVGVVPDVVQDANQAAQITSDPVVTPEVIDVPPVDNTQRDPGQVPIAQPDLTATPFALDSLALDPNTPPAENFGNTTVQDQQFAEADAALVDQQQGDIRLQEQLPLPQPAWVKPQPLPSGGNKGPLVLTEGADGKLKRSTNEPMIMVGHDVLDENGNSTGQIVDRLAPVAEVYEESRVGIRALNRLAHCLKGK
jgi:hypothetical protein